MTRIETPLPMKVIAPDAGRAWWWFGQLAKVKAGADETHGRYTLVEILAPPHYATPLHRHDREDEAFWVLEGETTFEVGGETVQGPPGTYLVAPRGIRHRLRAGASGARLLFSVHARRLRAADRGDQRRSSAADDPAAGRHAARRRRRDHPALRHRDPRLTARSDCVTS
jgi:quercetin dioxygenase-like cupin family protein